MSENFLVPSTSKSIASSSTVCKQKQLMNAATQHGNKSNADEENIVVLVRCNSPKRDNDEIVVWHEEFIQYYDVSTNFIILTFHRNMKEREFIIKHEKNIKYQIMCQIVIS
jgi:hypothetical protein